MSRSRWCWRWWWCECGGVSRPRVASFWAAQRSDRSCVACAYCVSGDRLLRQARVRVGSSECMPRMVSVCRRAKVLQSKRVLGRGRKVGGKVMKRVNSDGRQNVPFSFVFAQTSQDASPAATLANVLLFRALAAEWWWRSTTLTCHVSYPYTTYTLPPTYTVK